MKCKCRSGAGEPKIKFTSRSAAVTAAIRRGWAPTAYACPTRRGVWHITKGRSR